EEALVVVIDRRQEIEPPQERELVDVRIEAGPEDAGEARVGHEVAQRRTGVGAAVDALVQERGAVGLAAGVDGIVEFVAVALERRIPRANELGAEGFEADEALGRRRSGRGGTTGRER